MGNTLDRAARKGQSREERRRRRRERREAAAQAKTPKAKPQDGAPPPKARKSLPGFLGKYRRELSRWLRNYAVLAVKADDAGVEWARWTDNGRRKSPIQEYVEVTEFRRELDAYLAEEDAAAESR